MAAWLPFQARSWLRSVRVRALSAGARALLVDIAASDHARAPRPGEGSPELLELRASGLLNALASAERFRQRAATTGAQMGAKGGTKTETEPANPQGSQRTPRVQASNPQGSRRKLANPQGSPGLFPSPRPPSLSNPPPLPGTPLPNSPSQRAPPHAGKPPTGRARELRSSLQEKHAEALTDPRRAKALTLWLEHLDQRLPKALTPIGASRIASRLAKMPVDTLERAVEHSLQGNYQGLFEPHPTHGHFSTHPRRPEHPEPAGPRKFRHAGGPDPAKASLGVRDGTGACPAATPAPRAKDSRPDLAEGSAGARPP